MKKLPVGSAAAAGTDFPGRMGKVVESLILNRKVAAMSSQITESIEISRCALEASVPEC